MPNAKHSEPIVPLKVREAIEILLEQTVQDFPAAAKAVGLSTYQLRREMKKPHVLRYQRAEKQAKLEEVCLNNPKALAEIRDKGENQMAKVAAVRQSEAMRQAAAEETGGPRQSLPGLVIVIEGPGGSVRTIGPPIPPMIEVEPGAAGASIKRITYCKRKQKNILGRGGAFLSENCYCAGVTLTW
jgi:hypothetical protein